MAYTSKRKQHTHGVDFPCSFKDIFFTLPDFLSSFSLVVLVAMCFFPAFIRRIILSFCFCCGCVIIFSFFSSIKYVYKQKEDIFIVRSFELLFLLRFLFRSFNFDALFCRRSSNYIEVFVRNFEGYVNILASKFR